MNSFCSSSTISTTASLRCSISSKNMLRNGSGGGRTAASKAGRMSAKYKSKGVGGSRWRAPARRDSSLNNLIKPVRVSRNNVVSSVSSNLGRGIEAMRVGNKLSNAAFKGAPFSMIYFNSSDNEDAPSFFKSDELNQALHRDIDLKMSKKPEETSFRGQERWSAKSSGEKSGSALQKPTRRKSDDNLC